MADTTLGWRLVNPRMEALGHTDSLGQTAEHLAVEHGIARSEQDAFALRSHAKAVAAIDAGRLRRRAGRGRRARPEGDVTVAADEVPRRDSSLEALAGCGPRSPARGRSPPATRAR